MFTACINTTPLLLRLLCLYAFIMTITQSKYDEINGLVNIDYGSYRIDNPTKCLQDGICDEHR